MSDRPYKITSKYTIEVDTTPVLLKPYDPIYYQWRVMCNVTDDSNGERYGMSGMSKSLEDAWKDALKCYESYQLLDEIEEKEKMKKKLEKDIKEE